MPRSPHSRARLLAATACLAVFALAPAGATASGPVAHAAKSCSEFQYSGGYITSLSVKKTSCKTGKKVALAFTKCRTKSSKSGRCHSKVLGFSCHEGKRVSIPTEIDGRVTCTKGSKKVVHTYQQNI